MGMGSSWRSRSVDLTTSQKATGTIRNSWVEGRAPTARPHSGQNLARSTRALPQFGHVAMARSIWTIGQGNRPVGDSSSKREIAPKPGYPNGRRVATLSPVGDRAGSGAVAPERKRSARDYEQALKRQELAAGGGLGQAPPGAPPGPVGAAPPRPRPRPAERDATVQAGLVPARPGPGRRVGRAGPVRGRPRRRRGGRRTLGGARGPDQRR